MAVSANSATSLSLAGLGYGSYKAYAADVVGNLSTASSVNGNLQSAGLTTLLSTGSYSLGAGKGYLIKTFSYNGTIYATWSSNNDNTQDTMSHNSMDSVFGFIDSVLGGQIDTTNTVILNGITIKELSLTDLNNLSNTIITIYGSGSSGLSTLGWSNATYWSSSQASDTYQHFASTLSSYAPNNYDENTSMMLVFKVL